MPLLCGLIFIITLNLVADGLVINGRIDQCLYQDLSSHCLCLLVILKSGTRTCSGKCFLLLSWCSRLNISLVIRIMDINFLFSSYFIWSRSVLDIRTKRYCVHKKADDVFNALCAMDVSVLYWAHGGSCEVTMLARLYNQNFLWSKIIHLLRKNFKLLEGRGRGNGVISSFRQFSFR